MSDLTSNMTLPNKQDDLFILFENIENVTYIPFTKRKKTISINISPSNIILETKVLETFKIMFNGFKSPISQLKELIRRAHYTIVFQIPCLKECLVTSLEFSHACCCQFVFDKFNFNILLFLSFFLTTNSTMFFIIFVHLHVGIWILRWPKP